MTPLARALKSETAFPVLILTQCVASLVVMWLANYARDAAPDWHGPMRLFLLLMIGLALRDLLKARRAARVRVRVDARS